MKLLYSPLLHGATAELLLSLQRQMKPLKTSPEAPTVEMAFRQKNLTFGSNLTFIQQWRNDLNHSLIKSPTRWNLATKFSANHTAGSRILPSKSPKNDADYELRIDAGELVDNRYRNVYLQVNTQAKSSSLKKWLQKEGSHGKLGSAQYDTQAADLDAEAQRVVDDLVGQGKDKL